MLRIRLRHAAPIGVLAILAVSSLAPPANAGSAFAGGFNVSLKELRMRSDGFTLLLTVNGHAERVTMTATSSSIAAL
jgi:hypothetical protein